MSTFSPGDLSELREAIAELLTADQPLELVAGGSKRGLGRPMQTPHLLDLSRLSGIRNYEPSELVLTAGAATPLAEIEVALAQHHQMLAFEPPDWRKLLGAHDAHPTLGGAIACNLSGPRRPKAGAARDHFLGFRAVSGRAEIFKSGGRVVKNVTGYDLSKLMAGSYGTLAALEEVTVKVLSAPERVATVVLCGLAPTAALRVIGAALASPHEVSAAAYLPAGSVMPAMAETVALRLEGTEPSVLFRRERLVLELAGDCDWTVLEDDASTGFWRTVGNAEPFAAQDDRIVWRVSVAPARGAEVAETVSRALDADWYLDWGGGLVWLAVKGATDGGAAVIRTAIRGPNGRGTGHATLVRGPAALRRAVPVFEPQAPALATLAARVKDGFDPHHLLNPGRIVERS